LGILFELYSKQKYMTITKLGDIFKTEKKTRREKVYLLKKEKKEEKIQKRF
jgi:hypothetical protein